MIESETSDDIQCKNIQEVIDYMTHIRLMNPGAIIFFIDIESKDKDKITNDLLKAFPTAKRTRSGIEVGPEIDVHIDAENTLGNPPLEDGMLCRIVALIINEFLERGQSFAFRLSP